MINMKKNNFWPYILVSLFFLTIAVKLFLICSVNKDTYKEILANKTDITIKGVSAPRGRILDTNGKVIVDNVGINTVMYNKIKGITKDTEKEISLKLASILDVAPASVTILKEYYLFINDDLLDLITSEEYTLYNERKISKEELKKRKMERITPSMLESLSEIERKSATIYNLMNKGFLYQKKVILEDINKTECAKVVEANLPGITVEMSSKRIYFDDETLRSVLGSVGSITKDTKDEYLNKGYELTDDVGISYLEKQYESVLQGKKAIYKVNKDNTLLLVRDAKKGSDIVLSINLDIQKKVAETLKEKILLAKKRANTEYFSDSYAAISDPLTGSLLAISGERLNIDNTFSEVSANMINSSFTMGSIVKGATISVGYNHNLFDKTKYITDSCVKLQFVPAKCSFKSLGRINDIEALSWSSNYFQYLIAIGLTGNKYIPNIKLNATKEHFKIYRDTLASFGLGVKTGIDLPNETTGLTGKVVADDLLLNLAIGQYDTYTPLSVLQYMNTIANGKRTSLSLLKEINYSKEEKYINKPKVLNELEISKENLERIREGMHKSVTKGVATNYINKTLSPVGKTGTSESFFDSNNDGIVDTSTITSTFAGYFPKEFPKYSIVVISPNISHTKGKTDYTFLVARRISMAITDFLFEN
ncbi:MAG: penicillin-binding transpeptidase domain-containing protein [Bacilli bacterium]